MDANGLVRHGHLPEREIITGIGPVAVRTSSGPTYSVIDAAGGLWKKSQVRTGLAAGGRWIRTSGFWSRDRQTCHGRRGCCLETGPDLLRNLKFESISLQERVHCELAPIDR
jgi:hypothetical protein